MTASAPSSPSEFYIVFDHCDCEDPGCYGKTAIALFASRQTAEQEADLRSKRYGGSTGRPDMHMDKLPISTKISGY